MFHLFFCPLNSINHSKSAFFLLISSNSRSMMPVLYRFFFSLRAFNARASIALIIRYAIILYRSFFRTWRSQMLCCGKNPNQETTFTSGIFVSILFFNFHIYSETGRSALFHQRDSNFYNNYYGSFIM